MAGLGTFINALAIALGTGIGWLLGHRLPTSITQTVLSGMGLLVLVIGIQMALTATTATQAVIVLMSLVGGAVIGELLAIEARLEWVGQQLEAQITRYGGSSPITKAFVTASLLYVVGPLAILGSLQDGIQRDPSLLITKAALDGIAAVAFTSSLGIGVLFSIIPVVLYQGTITLLSQQIAGILSEAVIEALTATGGILVMGIGVNLLEIKQIRLGNLLPALGLAVLLVGILPIWDLG
ncbi:MAG: DUF554 domain-containing protein [Synechococcaceae cyanobacterium SM2_3_2]|nr:DUF554 domain-containing protein [Synechococcaceae cyanobacterium SM2_3_2]